jgi:hypothetical protein
MLAQLRGAPARVAIYAECGGLMYLGTTLEVTGGERYAMADIIPGHSRMGTRLTRFGYCEAQAQQQTLLAALASGCAAMNFITPIFLPPPLPYWPAVNSETVRRSSSGGRMAVRQRLCQLSPCPFCPAPHHAQPLAASGKEGAMTLLAWCVAWILDVSLAIRRTGRIRCAG